MDINYRNINLYKGIITEEIALNFLDQQNEYVYNITRITTNKNLILKALEKNKYLISIVEVSSYFKKEELKKLLYIYFKNNDVNSISERDYYGDTILIKSIKNNNIRLSELLIGNPYLDPNIQTKKFETALLTACKYSNSETVRLLMELPNIDIKLRDEYNHNALWHCLEFEIDFLGYLFNKAEDMTENEKLKTIKVLKDRTDGWIDLLSNLQKINKRKNKN